MALDDLGVVILPGKEIFAVAPGSEAPDGWKSTTIDPYRRVIGWISRRWEERGNHLIESLCRSRIRLADVDTIGRIRELEIVDRSSAEDLAQLGYGNASRLAPLLLNIRGAGIGSPAAVADCRRSKVPVVARPFQHQGCFFVDVDVATEAVFAIEGRLPECFR